jgi:hypothetical protein
MPVAKSYLDLPTCGDVYCKNNRAYIKVLMKSGNVKEVRWYSDKEFQKMYPELNITCDKARNYGPQMNCLGWRDPDDFITIFCGDVVKNEAFFESYEPARYHKIWGWYLIGGVRPNYEILPERIYPICLPWDMVGNEDGYLKSDEEVIKAIKKIVKEAYNYYARK